MKFRNYRGIKVNESKLGKDLKVGDEIPNIGVVKEIEDYGDSLGVTVFHNGENRYYNYDYYDNINVVNESVKVIESVKVNEYVDPNSDYNINDLKEDILNAFRTSDQEVLNSYDQGDSFFIECGNTNSMYLSYLHEDLYKLIDKYPNLSYEKESNDNGFYGYTYEFYLLED